MLKRFFEARSRRQTREDLILAAVCTLQEKNGVGACEIVEYVANKRGCKVEQVEGTIRMILCHAKMCDIFVEKKGCYRINECYDDISECTPYTKDKACKGKGKKKQKYCCIDKDNYDDDDDELNSLCACLKLSKKNLKDDEEDKKRCPHKKKRK